jgi:hypothetical protein
MLNNIVVKFKHHISLLRLGALPDAVPLGRIPFDPVLFLTFMEHKENIVA